MIEHNTHRKAVVIGGGYAGTVAANRLRRRTDVDIALVDPRPEFVDRIRLHQFVSGTGDVAVDYGTLLGEGIELVVDSATHIDTDTVPSRIAGTEPAVVDPALIGTCISHGRRVGIRQLARKDDTAVNFYIGGRAGARIKEVTCKVGVGKIRREAHKPGSLIWPKGGPRPASAASVVTSI
jgi:NADH dehydrogenase